MKLRVWPAAPAVKAKGFASAATDCFGLKRPADAPSRKRVRNKIAAWRPLFGHLLLSALQRGAAMEYQAPMGDGGPDMLDNITTGTIVIEDLEIGMKRSLQKLVTDRDIELFAEVSTDRNPVHLDDSYAQDTIFEGRIAHGMLTAGLISAVIGEQLPGHGTVYLGQTLKFMAPVRPGDMVRAEVEVMDIDYGKRRVTLATHCTVDDTVVLKGEAVVLAPSGKFD
jgi:3-hydroxybutyryl-CoA dehydratase